MPPDPYERLQAARTAVKALADERSMLAVRLVDLAKGSDEEALVEASMKLDALPIELLRPSSSWPGPTVRRPGRPSRRPRPAWPGPWPTSATWSRSLDATVM